MNNTKKSRMVSKLNILIGMGRDVNVTFINNDNTKVNQSLNNRFINDKNGKARSPSAIINDLYAITHDKNAKTFYI
jgi:hypothetical protein